MAMTDTERRARYVQKKRQRDRAAERAERQAAAAAVALYRKEKAASLKRNAGKIAEAQAAVERALAKADADRNPRNRAGRPRRMPSLHLTSDPANALINALTPWGFGE